MRRALILAGLLALTSCAAPPAPPPAAPVAPPATPPPPPPPPPPLPPDTCGARELQSLVGRPRTEIPVPVQPSSRRVVCTTCQMTQDFSETRQTIVFDAQTGLVKSVTCG